MNGFSGQFLVESFIDKLVLFDAAQASESCRDNLQLQVIATPGEILHLDLGIGQDLTHSCDH